MSLPRKVPAAQVKARFGVSDMSLWRWMNDPKLAFPKPIYIRRRRYWDEAELDEFDRRVNGDPLAMRRPQGVGAARRADVEA